MNAKIFTFDSKEKRKKYKMTRIFPTIQGKTTLLYSYEYEATEKYEIKTSVKVLDTIMSNYWTHANLSYNT